jgi:hypothetical protein
MYILPRLKKVKFSLYTKCAVVIIALAMLLRIVLTALGWPVTNSDESTMGLMAVHIASLKDFPIFFWGQDYMGAFEAYLGAVLFHFFGVSVFTLRLGTMLEFALFLVCMYFLASLLYTKKLALVTLLLLSVGSVMMLFTEFMAHGGYPEILCFGAAAFLLASWLAFSSDQDLSLHWQWRRMLAFGCWGLVVALGFWSDYIFLSIILMSGFLLVLFCWRELLRRAILPLLLGFLIGAVPLIIYNVNAPSWQNTLAVIKALHNSAWSILASSPVYGHFPILAQIKGTMLFTLPMAVGAPPLCFDSDWVILGHGGVPVFHCFNYLHGNTGLLVIALCWSIGFIVLWMISVFHELRMLWKLQQWYPGQPGSSVQRQAFICHFARLVLLGSAGLTLLQFTSSPISAVFPEYSRYLVGLLIATPALIAPLWGLSHDSHQEYSSASARHPLAVHLATVSLVLRRGILLFIGVVLLLGTISVFYEIPTAQAVNQQQNALIRDLLRIRANHIYTTDYWACNRLAFLTKEQIICAVVNDRLQDIGTRPPHYYTIVKADPHSVIMFPVGSAQASAIAKRVALLAGHYRRLVFDGYVVYQPVNGKAP